MANYIAEQVGKDVSEMPYDVLISDELRNEFGSATFFTATDGNHGKGVAWSANKLRQKAVIFMPKGTTQNRLERIRAEGATVTIEDKNYDECVRMAASAAEQTKNGVIVQDTAWDGYEEIPTWIMQGYGTLSLEADEQMKEYGCSSPTHVFVQAGTGAFAGSVQGYFAGRYPENPPTVIVVEPDAAACHYESAAAGGEIRTIGGDMQSIMAGLACGEPCSISWDILKNNSRIFTSCPDWVTVRGMRMLAAPIKGDRQVTSGESGAATAGLLASIMIEPEYEALRKAAGLGADSRVLLVSTEGDTDPDRYKNIVWNASYNPSAL
jgi:diaminopropionate ammonia-lyase